MLEFIMRYDSKALPVRMETIVRCKDCEFLAIDRWFGTDYFCSMLRMTIEPNGFCA